MENRSDKCKRKMELDSSRILSADEARALLMDGSFEGQEDEDSDDTLASDSDDGDLAEGDFTTEDGSHILVDGEVISHIRSSSLFVASCEVPSSHRDSLLLLDPDFCRHESSNKDSQAQEGTKYMALVE